MTTFFIILAMPIFLIVTGMVLYPVAQAFGLFTCNCGRSPEDKWSCSVDASKSRA
jgi:Ni,Fe-hydrogenase I cytochrome b subunit